MSRYRWQSETRFYEVFIRQDLLGDWVVIQVWGGLGNALGGIKNTPVLDETAAEVLLAEIMKTRKRHGYQLTGASSP